jgi:hypothetical protein
VSSEVREVLKGRLSSLIGESGRGEGVGEKQGRSASGRK